MTISNCIDWGKGWTGRAELPKWMKFRKTFKWGGRSFSIQKFMLQILDLYIGLVSDVFWKKMQYSFPRKGHLDFFPKQNSPATISELVKNGESSINIHGEKIVQSICCVLLCQIRHWRPLDRGSSCQEAYLSSTLLPNDRLLSSATELLTLLWTFDLTSSRTMTKLQTVNFQALNWGFKHPLLLIGSTLSSELGKCESIDITSYKQFLAY